MRIQLTIHPQGYLIDQFTQSTCNTRTDSWGGSVVNRSRFALSIASGLVSALGASKVGIRLSPFSDFQGMKVGFIRRFPSAFEVFVEYVCTVLACISIPTRHGRG